MAPIKFHHNFAGDLTIDTGIDNAAWAYGLNTISFPTYGGEVVQILSVYIDDLTLTGTCTTYEQIESIYEYFSAFFQAATQGKNSTPRPGFSSFNLSPMTFQYPERGWAFEIYPLSTPGFRKATEITAPTWQLTAHVIDNSPDLRIITEGIKGASVASLQQGTDIAKSDVLNIDGNISPKNGDPNTDPFQTFDPGQSTDQEQISRYADYYNSLIPAYMQGDFKNIVGAIGSQPNFGRTRQQPKGNNTVKVPKGAPGTGIH